MSEKEIVEPGRKRKTSGSEEKPAVKKTTASKKAASDISVEKKSESKDFVLETTGEMKPAKKKRTAAKKTLTTKKTGDSAASELSAAAGSELAEAARVVEEITGASAPVVKKPRRKAAAAAKKTKLSAPSSDEILKKAPAKKSVSKAKKEKAAAVVVETSIEVKAVEPVSAETASKTTPTPEQSPIFKELSEPKLPALSPENRARLQIQSPTRIFFYWSIKNDPFETMSRAFPPGRARDYALSVKLVNLKNKSEEIYPVEASGSYWFNADSNTAYRAEIGFFAANRPFVRLMYSNTVETPRSAPSPNQDWSMDFTVSANQFAEVLDASGYAQDAFEVEIAGDDRSLSDAATRETFFRITGEKILETDFDELRSALFALASGFTLESLRGQIGASLFFQMETMMRENAEKMSAEKILAALKESFHFEDEDEEFLTPVFGASAINFPRKSRLPKFSPVSSF